MRAGARARLRVRAAQLRPEDRMTRLVALGLALAAFSALSVHAVLAHGYLGVFEAFAASPATRLGFVDLSLSLGLVLLWMWDDARERALLLELRRALTLGFGVAGPLAYLIHRSSARSAAARRRAP
jgi:hypothetical protein